MKAAQAPLRQKKQRWVNRLKTFQFITEGSCHICPSHAYDKNNYMVIDINTKGYKLHKIVYEHTYGKIKDGDVIHHLCGNKKCLNPIHIVALSVEEHDRHHAKGRNMKVVQINPTHGLLKVWDSQTDAGRAGYTQQSISAACAWRKERELHMDCWWMEIK